jgi:hypothetical protein
MEEPSCIRPVSTLLPTLAAGFLLLVAGSALVRTASAQTNFGTIVGNVVDASGASVPGATVRVTEAQTGDSRSAETNETGVYTISTVSAGSYRVSIRKEGFKDFEAEI